MVRAHDACRLWSYTKGVTPHCHIENEVKDPDLLSEPTRIYNADETGVSLCLKGSQVIGVKGAPVVYQLGNSDKTQITVMAACSAAAHYIPPMLGSPTIH